MKKALLLFTLLFFTLGGFSQDPGLIRQDKGFIAISAGLSIPAGEFASKDLNSPSAGIAATGGMLDLSAGFKLGKNFGITALYRGYSNPVDDEAFLDELKRNYPTINWKVESEGWSMKGIMFGGYGSFPVGAGNTNFIARAMVGFMKASSPEVKLTGTLNGSSAWEQLNSISASSSLAFLLGAGFKFNVESKVCLLLNVDYLGTSPEFQNPTISTSAGTLTGDTYKQNIGVLSISVGIGLRL